MNKVSSSLVGAKFGRVVESLILCTMLAGCFSKTADQYLLDAKAALDKKDNAAAVIQLKNALQENPSLQEARFLLGKASLDIGDARGAIIELEKAKELGQPADDVTPALARAMFAAGQAENLLRTYGNTRLGSPAAMADLKATLAIAYGSLGQTTQAAESIKAAIAADGSNFRAQVIGIRLAAANGATDEAFNGVNRLLAKLPKESEVWELKGDLFLRSGKYGDALKSYREAVALNKGNLGSQIGIMTLLLRQKDLEGATAQLATLRAVKTRPEQVLMFTAVLALEKGDLKLAQESVQVLLKSAPEDVRVLHLAGAIEFHKGALLEADNFLTKALQAAPDSNDTRILLGQTKMREGDSAKAIELLQPLLLPEGGSAEALAIAAEAYLQTGELKRAEECFAKASQLNPKDVRSRVALAQMEISRGRLAEGVAALRTIAASDPSPLPDLALVTALTQRQDWPQALVAISQLEGKTSGRPTAAQLRGGVNLASGNRVQARKDFETALKIDPLFFPAAQSLAALDAEEKRYDAAKARFKKILAEQPASMPANLALVAISAKAGATKEELVDMLDKVIKLVPTEAPPRIALVEAQIQNKDLKAAKTAAQEAVTALPENPQVWDLLGQVQTLSGDANQALIAFNTWASLVPKSPEPPLAIAKVYAMQGDKAAQVRSIKRSLNIKPDYLQAQVALFAAEMGQGHFVEARRIAQEIRAQRPAEAVGLTLSGDLNAKQKNWVAAAADYRAGLKLQPVSDLAVKLHQTLISAGKLADAKIWETDWMTAHPQDVAFLEYLSNLALSKQDYGLVEQRYLAILKSQPDNAAVANNLAWLLHETKRPGALAYAEKANQIAPDHPAFLDTLASIYADSGQPEKALATQKRAVVLAPDFALHRLHLARYYIALGRKDEARTELTLLAALGDEFAQQPEVNKLLSSL